MKEKGGVCLSTCEIKGTSSLGVKVVSTLDFTSPQVFDTLMDKKTKLADSEYNLVSELGGNYRVTHTRVPIPLFSDSDFCCGEWSGDLGVAKIYAFTSVTHPKCPPTMKSIRGKMIVGGWYMVPTKDGKCQATMISVVDPCRSFPSALARSTAEKSGKSMITLRKAVEARVAAMEGSASASPRGRAETMG